MTALPDVNCDETDASDSSRSMLRSRQLAIVVLLFTTLLGAGKSRMLGDSDCFWHLAVGINILSEGRVPISDQYSITHSGKTWIAYEWFGECLMAFAYRFAGFDGMVLLAVVPLVAIYGWAGYGLERRGVHWLPALLVLLIGVACGANHFLARPHVWTIAFLGLVFLVIIRIERYGGSLQRLWFLPPLCLVWTNIHGGVLGGLGTLSIAVAAWLFFYWRGWVSPIRDRRGAWTAIGSLITSWLTIFLTPYGWRAAQTWVQILTDDLSSIIQEHAPLSIFEVDGFVVVVMAVLYLVLLVSARSRPSGIAWLLPLVWLWLAFRRVRHGSLFGVACLMVMPDLIANSRWAELWQSRGWLRLNPPKTRNVAPCAALLTGLALTLIAAGWHYSTPPQVAGTGWARPPSTVYPVELLPDLKRFLARDPPGKIFNEMQYGGFLILHTQGQVFIDGRCELYGLEHYRGYLRLANQPALLQRILNDNQIRTAVVKRDADFDQTFRSLTDWQVAVTTPDAVVHRRRAEAP